MHLNFADRVAGRHASAQSSSVTSSLARAFTTSSKAKNDRDNAPSSAHMGRASSQRGPIRPSQISLPVALVSTTNMLSYDAPDIAGAINSRSAPHNMLTFRKASSVSSTSDEDAHSRGDRSSVRSRSSQTTDATSLSVEAFSPGSLEQNHLSCYFKPTTGATTAPYCRMSSTSRSDSLMSGGQSPVASPQVPSRAPAHSKKAHVLSHKRSVSRGMISPPTTHSRHDSADMFNTTCSPKSTMAVHPFGRELEQLNEAAEEFSCTVRDVEQDVDLGVLKAKGLGNFCATEYMLEIAPLFSRAYGEEMSTSTPTWI